MRTTSRRPLGDVGSYLLGHRMRTDCTVRHRQRERLSAGLSGLTSGEFSGVR